LVDGELGYGPDMQPIIEWNLDRSRPAGDNPSREFRSDGPGGFIPSGARQAPWALREKPLPATSARFDPTLLQPEPGGGGRRLLLGKWRAAKGAGTRVWEGPSTVPDHCETRIRNGTALPQLVTSVLIVGLLGAIKRYLEARH
jgi:hypothetical protein